MGETEAKCPYCSDPYRGEAREDAVLECKCEGCRGRFLLYIHVARTYRCRPVPGGKPSVWARSDKASPGYRRWHVAQSSTETIQLEYEVHLGWQIITYTGGGTKEVELVDRKTARLALRINDKAPCSAYKNRGKPDADGEE